MKDYEIKHSGQAETVFLTKKVTKAYNSSLYQTWRKVYVKSTTFTVVINDFNFQHNKSWVYQGEGYICALE